MLGLGDGEWGTFFLDILCKLVFNIVYVPACVCIFVHLANVICEGVKFLIADWILYLAVSLAVLCMCVAG